MTEPVDPGYPHPYMGGKNVWRSDSGVEGRLAHPALRASAFIIDGLVTVLVSVIVVYSAFFFGWESSPFFAIGVYGVPILAAIVATITTATRGTTLGKKTLGLQVVDARTGRSIGPRAILRSLIIVAPLAITYGFQSALSSWTLTSVALLAGPILPVALWLALLIVVALAPGRRGLQDLAGWSVVIHKGDTVRLEDVGL